MKTVSGAVAVQIVHSSRRGSRTIENVGSAHEEAERAVLKAGALQRLANGQVELDLGLAADRHRCRCRCGRCWSPGPSSWPLQIALSRTGPLWDGMRSAYDQLGFDRAAADEVFRQLVLGRIAKPTSTLVKPPPAKRA